jgi:heme/copper-type cytochrome/quinol oxidase subunit 3
MRTLRVIGDVSHLPEYGFGASALGWWGTVGFILIEGMAFVLGLGTLFYLVPLQPSWPPSSPPPSLLWGSLFTVVVLLSEIPNVLARRAARACDLNGARIGLAFAVLVGLVLAVIRAFEFGALNVTRDHDAYGSIVWALLLMHTVHVATDVYDTIVLAVLAFLRPLDGRRFSDVEDNATYWHFVVIAWLVLYVAIYWLPRLLGHG